MLVLTRKANEGVQILGPCRVVVVSIKGDQVRLGFEAARDVAVHRDEIAEAIRKQGGRRGNRP